MLDEEEVYGNTHSEENRILLQMQNELINSRDGGKLLAVSVCDGVAQQTIDLESQPVWDGMAAGYGKLYICCQDGSVVAFDAGGVHARQSSSPTFD